MKCLLLVMFFIGCTQPTGSTAPVPHKATCVSAGGMWRCENDEVICYLIVADALQCKWKEK